MRNHLVGFGLLLVLAAAVWGTARLAAPAVGNAFETEDRADDDTEDVIDLTVGSAPLTSEEVINLQLFLFLEGYETGGADGLIGPMTRAAIQESIQAHELDPETTDRALLEYLTALYNGPELGDDPVEESVDAEGTTPTDGEVDEAVSP